MVTEHRFASPQTNVTKQNKPGRTKRYDCIPLPTESATASNPHNSDLPAGTGGIQILLAGTHNSSYVSRPEMHHVLGDNWDSNRDEDSIGVDLEQGEEYTVRLRTKTSLPVRLQATELKVLGIYDSNGNAISGTASAGAAGKTVFITDWEAPSTGRYYIAVGTEGTDRTGAYWLSITRKVPD